METKSVVKMKIKNYRAISTSACLLNHVIKESNITFRSNTLSSLVTPSSTPVPRWFNGWSWKGTSYQSLVHLKNNEVPVMRKCYPAIKHTEGVVVRMRDCILLNSGSNSKDLPFVAKVSALWENKDGGEMMMSLLWYYRPSDIKNYQQPTYVDDEIFASRHLDVCSVACIEDKCYVLTFNEYCRFVRTQNIFCSVN